LIEFFIHSKRQLRAEARLRRSQQPQPAEASRQIMQQLTALPSYQAARVVLWYLHFRDEVQTIETVARQLDEKQVVVPYCQEGKLQLVRLQSMDELSAGAYGIPEPAESLRNRPERQVSVEEVDFVVTPGVAFDRQGGRLGYGKGYYDKLLQAAEPQTVIAAVAFECQMFDRIPMSPHDTAMHCVVTEKAIYPPPTI